MKLKQQFMLPAVLWTVTAPAEYKDHWVLSLQFGELAPLCRVIGKLVIGEHSPWNNVRSHMQTTFLSGHNNIGRLGMSGELYLIAKTQRMNIAR